MEFWVIEMEFRILNFVENLSSVITLEGKISAQEHVKDDAHGPTVAERSVIAFDHTRRHIVRCTSDRLHAFLLGLSFRKAEIDDFNLIV